WRDSAIYLDEIIKEDKLVQVTVYHRGAAAPEPFHFSLDVKSDPSNKIEVAALLKRDADEIAAHKALDLENEVKSLLALHGPMDRKAVISALGSQRQKTLSAITASIVSGDVEEVKQSGSSAKFLKFREPLGTGTSMAGSGSTPYKGGTENPSTGGPNG
ncbi:MAG: hypothetical protein WCO26_12060, partial [Deltaproteobacteria bacterium]